jgi:hypothetical protein
VVPFEWIDITARNTIKHSQNMQLLPNVSELITQPGDLS